MPSLATSTSYTIADRRTHEESPSLLASSSMLFSPPAAPDAESNTNTSQSDIKNNFGVAYSSTHPSSWSSRAPPANESQAPSRSLATYFWNIERNLLTSRISELEESQCHFPRFRRYSSDSFSSSDSDDDGDDVAELERHFLFSTQLWEVHHRLLVQRVKELELERDAAWKIAEIHQPQLEEEKCYHRLMLVGSDPLKSIGLEVNLEDLLVLSPQSSADSLPSTPHFGSPVLEVYSPSSSAGQHDHDDVLPSEALPTIGQYDDDLSCDVLLPSSPSVDVAPSKDTCKSPTLDLNSQLQDIQRRLDRAQAKIRQQNRQANKLKEIMEGGLERLSTRAKRARMMSFSKESRGLDGICKRSRLSACAIYLTRG
jgi:hypothetical protein